ncbi:hypothetical protein [Caulobacter sp. UNC279MFTsu5.1]|uniref:hypothetical protein n=1 Tax=Caulobacter sp. UNC279MFTsu5.1 TaxID=1502775 RepID=UPI0011600C0A|nr:hypothetical protein [Caulobacter sp. UNC279MFTsu5.1]
MAVTGGVKAGENRDARPWIGIFCEQQIEKLAGPVARDAVIKKGVVGFLKLSAPPVTDHVAALKAPRTQPAVQFSNA